MLAEPYSGQVHSGFLDSFHVCRGCNQHSSEFDIGNQKWIDFFIDHVLKHI